MNKIITSAAIAVAFGIMVMLVPIMTYTHTYPQLRDDLPPVIDENYFDKTSGLEGDARPSPPEDATQTYRKTDVDSASLSLSLYQAAIIAAAGFLVAVGMSLLLKEGVVHSFGISGDRKIQLFYNMWEE